MALSIWEALIDAFFWCLTGFLGSVQAAASAHSDVPPLQCLVGSLAFIIPIFLLEIFVFDKIRERKRERRWQEENKM